MAQRGDVNTDAPGFIESLKQHFNRLPTRYALDVNIESLDVLSHKRLLDEARSDPTTVSFSVRPVEVVVQRQRDMSSGSPMVSIMLTGPIMPRCALTLSMPQVKRAMEKALPKPAFGSSPNLQVGAPNCGSIGFQFCSTESQLVSSIQALAIEAGEKLFDSNSEELPSPSGHHDGEHMAFYEITVASADQPKLLSRLSEALVRLGFGLPVPKWLYMALLTVALSHAE